MEDRRPKGATSANLRTRSDEYGIACAADRRVPASGDCGNRARHIWRLGSRGGAGSQYLRSGVGAGSADALEADLKAGQYTLSPISSAPVPNRTTCRRKIGECTVPLLNLLHLLIANLRENFGEVRF